MKKTLLGLIISISIFGCSDNDDPVTPAPAPNNTTVSQDSRLIGGWRLDSTLLDTTMDYGGPGYLGPFTDSVNLSVAYFNGNIPVSDINCFLGLPDTVIHCVSGYFWDTSGDSLFIRVGNHNYNPVYRMRFFLNGNNLILYWKTVPTIPRSYNTAINYYHR